MKKKFKYNYRDYQVYSVGRWIKRCFREVKNGLMERQPPLKSLITLYPEETPKGRVLFSYNIKGFLLDADAPIPKTHTNIWQSVKMAETFVEFGYEVDIIHFTNTVFLPKRDYSFFVDVRHNLERLAPFLNKDCVKIMHLDTAHILFHNASESKRLLQLQERRGVTLRPQRFEMPNHGIEHADYATTGGNDFTIGTFKYANKKIFKLPSPCGIQLDWPKKKWDQCRKRFLWFSSYGFVHKGLDLALEVFKKTPDYHLIVCAPMERDKDFIREYYNELYETPNIKTVGWVDIDSKEFREITESCGTMLHLSCSEGGAPSVKMCMHAGLIPIVSYESGIDVHDFGFILEDCSIASVINIIRKVASLSPNEIEEKAHKAWESARRYHTRKNFASEYRNVILNIIEDVENNRYKT
jgi:glycosyltransferase involved in cell wall biosynthesis